MLTDDTLTDDELTAWTRPSPDDGLLSSVEVCTLAGITYRQLDYWLRTGAVDAEIPAAGSGSHRRFTTAQAADMALLARLTRLDVRSGNLRTAAEAVRLWRQQGGTGLVGISDGQPWTGSGDDALAAVRGGAALLLVDPGEGTAVPA